MSENENGSAAGKMYRLVERAKKYKAEAEQSAQALTALRAEHDQLKTKLTSLEADPAGKRVVELQKALRSRDWRDQFNQLATDKYKAKKDALELLWEQSKLDVNADAPDLAALDAALVGHSKKYAFAFGADPEPEAVERVEEPVAPPPSSGRAASSTTGGVPIVSKSMLSDGVQTWNNWSSVVAAAKAGTIRG